MSYEWSDTCGHSDVPWSGSYRRRNSLTGVHLRLHTSLTARGYGACGNEHSWLTYGGWHLDSFESGVAVAAW